MIAMLMLAAARVEALQFLDIPNDGSNRRILLVYDCGSLERDGVCLEHEKSFTAEGVYSAPADNDTLARIKQLGLRFEVDGDKKTIYYEHRGDERELQRRLGSRPVEVWLRSGGGHVTAGYGIGKVLRDARAVVRVPSAGRLAEAGARLARNRAPSCISACTVAFMGGLFRYVDEQATYQVHAASRVMTLSGDSKSTQEIVERVSVHGFQAQANEIAKTSRESVREALVHFHDTLLLPLGEAATTLERTRRDQELRTWVIEAPAAFPYPAAALARDRRLFELEGTAALQDVLMRLERQAIDEALRDLTARLSRLGRRADAALAMVVAMYDTSSIQETNVMARETMFKMGYITEDVK